MEKKKIIYQLGARFFGILIIGLLFILFMIAVAISRIKNGDILISIIMFVFIVLFLFGLILILNRKVVFENKTMRIPKDIYNGLPQTKILIEYENLVSVILLTKEMQGNHSLDHQGKKAETIVFKDIAGNSYRLRTQNFNKKQIQFIINETKKRAKI